MTFGTAIFLAMAAASNAVYAQPPQINFNLPASSAGAIPKFVSPNGSYAMATIWALDTAGDMSPSINVYVDLKTGTAHELTLPVYDQFYVLDDGRGFYGWHMDKYPNDLDPLQIDFVELDRNGGVASRVTVWDVKSDSIGDDQFVSKTGKLFFVDGKDQKARLKVFDPITKSAQILLEAKTVFPFYPKSASYASKPYPSENNWIAVYTAPCSESESCLSGKVYAVNLNDSRVRQLNIPDKSENGLLSYVSLDQKSNSPWVGVYRCVNSSLGAVNSIYNLETDEERILFTDKKHCTSYLKGETFAVRGRRIFWAYAEQYGKPADVHVYNLDTNEMLNQGFVSLSADGEKGIYMNASSHYILREFGAGVDVPAFQVPMDSWPLFYDGPLQPGERNNTEWLPNNSGHVWLESVPKVTGEKFAVTLTESPIASSKAPKAFSIEGDLVDPYWRTHACILDRQEDKLVCMTVSHDDKSKVLHVWKSGW